MPTMKVMRGRVLEHHRADVERMYAGRSCCVLGGLRRCRVGAVVLVGIYIDKFDLSDSLMVG